MTRADVDLRSASDALRSELIFLPDDGSLARIDGGLVLLTPSNPTFWWGNSLRFDRAPRHDDFERWMRAFETHVHAVQPASSHRTFGWDGDDRGEVGRFVADGFEYFEIIGLTAGRDQPLVAPHRAVEATPHRIAGDDWGSLCEMLVATRDPKHSEAAHREFTERQIDGWRALEARGQGGWFGIVEGGRVVSALGVFAERERGPDGRRIGRFQQVATLQSARRRGLCGTLVEHASRFAFAQLDVDTLRIAADENDAARRVYEGCGYRIVSRHRGLERGN